MNSEYTHIKHEFEPVFDKNSKILVLGTLPSVKSRENNFYYGHRRTGFGNLLRRYVMRTLSRRLLRRKNRCCSEII